MLFNQKIRVDIIFMTTHKLNRKQCKYLISKYKDVDTFPTFLCRILTKVKYTEVYLEKSLESFGFNIYLRYLIKYFHSSTLTHTHIYHYRVSIYSSGWFFEHCYNAIIVLMWECSENIEKCWPRKSTIRIVKNIVERKYWTLPPTSISSTPWPP